MGNDRCCLENDLRKAANICRCAVVSGSVSGTFSTKTTYEKKTSCYIKNGQVQRCLAFATGHHVTLHFVHNKNQQKQQGKQVQQRAADSKKDEVRKESLKSEGKKMAFSASRTSKRASLRTITLGHARS